MMDGKVKAAIYCTFLIITLIAGFIKVQSVPQMPHRFYGYVIVAGELAPNGTLIEAKIENITYATTTTVNGKYGWIEAFYVPADDPDTPEKEGGQAGDTIEFYVAKTYAASYTFEYGGITELNLTITAPTPYAEFTANVTSGTEPLTVEFIDQSMYFDNITSRTWDFGDGNITTTTSANITHTYAQNGTYTVSLTVNGSSAGTNVTATEVKVDYIIVYDTKPEADFYAIPTAGAPPLTVSFYDNSSSYDGIIEWAWDFGDGNITTTTSANITHTYTQNGTYTVSLTVTEPDGDNDTHTKTNYIIVQLKPVITINSPTTENPVYTQSAQSINVTLTYTESNPLNETITVYNSTTIIAESTITTLTPGTNVTTIVSIDIPSWASDGKYNVNVTMFNTYNLSTTVTQENAVIIDNTLPVIAITYPTEGAYLSAETIWINGTVTEENLNGLEPSINDTRFTLAYWDSTSGAFAFKNGTAVEDGPLTLEINFTDLAGCTGSATISFIQDTTPPVISTPYQDPPGQIVEPGQTVEVEPGQNITVRVNVTDIAVKEVILSYNITTTEWQNITMQLVGNEYVATIPSSELPAGTTIYYYIIAIDNANNVAKTPPNGTFFQFHVIPEFLVAVMLLMLMLTATSMAVALRKKATFKNKS